MGKYIEVNKTAWEEAFDQRHSMSEIISGMCSNEMVITGLQEFDSDISGGFAAIDHSGFPLSMIIQGLKNRREVTTSGKR